MVEHSDFSTLQLDFYFCHKHSTWLDSSCFRQSIYSLLKTVRHFPTVTGPSLDLAAINLTPADTFVELLRIAPDPSVTFSHGCLLVSICNITDTGIHVMNECYVSLHVVVENKKKLRRVY